MDDKMIEVLTAHVEGSDEAGGGAASATTDKGPYAEMMNRLRQVMVPVEPSADFVRSLGRELVEASRRRQEAARRLRRGLLIGAAALGSAASVAGMVTLVVLRRRTHTQPALPPDESPREIVGTAAHP